MKKRLAIPSDNGQLSQHFGHSPLFVFYDIEDGKIVNKEEKTPPPHAEGTIPGFLIKEGATDILTGGIGPKAVQMLYNKGINVYVGVELNTPDNLALDFINGDLKFGQNYCHH